MEVLHLYVVEIGGLGLHLADARLPGPDCYEYIPDYARLAGLHLRALLLDGPHDLLDVLEGLVDVLHNLEFLVAGDGPGYFLDDAHVLQFGDELAGVEEKGMGVAGVEGVGQLAVEETTAHHHCVIITRAFVFYSRLNLLTPKFEFMNHITAKLFTYHFLYGLLIVMFFFVEVEWRDRAVSVWFTDLSSLLKDSWGRNWQFFF